MPGCFSEKQWEHMFCVFLRETVETLVLVVSQRNSRNTCSGPASIIRTELYAKDLYSQQDQG